MWNIEESQFFDCPEKFLKLDQKVRAITTVFDLPGNVDQGPIHANVGEIGVVIHVEDGFWPTVRFDRTGTSTCVTSFEVVLCE